MNYTLYNIITNGSITSIVQSIDSNTAFYFLPSIVLIAFLVILFSNKQNFKHGFVYASFISIIVALLIKAMVPYFNEIYIMLTIFAFIISVLVLIFV